VKKVVAAIGREKQETEDPAKRRAKKETTGQKGILSTEDSLC